MNDIVYNTIENIVRKGGKGERSGYWTKLKTFADDTIVLSLLPYKTMRREENNSYTCFLLSYNVLKSFFQRDIKTRNNIVNRTQKNRKLIKYTYLGLRPIM